MNLSDIDPLQVYVLTYPLLILAVGLGIFWLTGWLDRREQHRHPAE